MTATLPPATQAEPVALPRVRGRRNPVLLAAGGALVVLSGAGVAWMVSAVADAEPVLVTAHALPAGATIGFDDLTVAQVSLDPAVASVPASQRDALIGQRAAVALGAGQLLTPSSLTASLVPAEGQSLVGVAVTADRLPATPLLPGDPVTLIAGARDGDDLPTGAPASMPGTVAGSRTLDDGSIVVDVTVPTGQAGTLAGWVSTGRVLIIREAVTTP
jgi:hypothetical protein